MYSEVDVYEALSERDRRSLYDDEEAGFWFDHLLFAASVQPRRKGSIGSVLLSMKQSGTKFKG